MTEIPSSRRCEQGLEVDVLRHYHALWNARQYPGRNPVPQPVSLERSCFEQLRTHRYYVSDKSDGTRYVLFLVRAQGKDLALMIDRKLCLYQISLAAGKSYFQGSIFDGELVTLSCGSHMFLVFDVIALRGECSIGEQPLDRRLEAIRNIFDLEDGQQLLVGMGGAPDTATRRSLLGSLGVAFLLRPELQAAMAAHPGAILEASISEEAGRPVLGLHALRTDKAHPNSGTTVLRTLRNARENISLEEVLELSRQAP